jgi:hypothetical protein
MEDKMNNLSDTISRQKEEIRLLTERCKHLKELAFNCIAEIDIKNNQIEELESDIEYWKNEYYEE